MEIGRKINTGSLCAATSSWRHNTNFIITSSVGYFHLKSICGKSQTLIIVRGGARESGEGARERRRRRGVASEFVGHWFPINSFC